MNRSCYARPEQSVFISNDVVHCRPQSYLQSFYFAFISFSTVGLGDFSIEVDSKGRTTALLLCTMFFGVCCFSSFIAVLNNTIQKLVRKADYLVVTTVDDNSKDKGEDSDGSEDDDLVHIMTERESSHEAKGNRLLRPLSMDLGGWKFESRPATPTSEEEDAKSRGPSVI